MNQETRLHELEQRLDAAEGTLGNFQLWTFVLGGILLCLLVPLLAVVAAIVTAVFGFINAVTWTLEKSFGNRDFPDGSDMSS